MKKWEYGDVTVPKDAQWQTVELLDAAGAEGWEATGIVDETHHVKIYLMKRPVEGTVDAPEVEVKHDHSVTRKCGAFCDLRGTKHEITKTSY